MTKTKEDFLPDIGGFLDGVAGDIVEAVFDIAGGEYADKVLLGGGASKPPVVLTLTIESSELKEPATQSFSVGSQDIWEVVDNGKRIENIKNPDKHTFRDGSIAMELVKAMAASMGAGDIEKGQNMFVTRDHFMTESEFYTGLSFDWEVRSITRKIGNKEVTSKPPLPINFLGETATKGATVKGKGVESNDVLDQVLVDNAGGKTDRELKSFAVRQETIKANDPYMKSIVSGNRLKELENAGKLTKDPSTDRYL